MYPDAGPSRSGASYNGVGYGQVPEGGSRAGSGRWEEERDWERGRERDDRDRANGYSRAGEPSTRPYNPASQHSRGPLPRSDHRPFPPSGPPARRFTPSPPRRQHDLDRDREYERERNGPSGYDVRDRLSLDTGYRASISGGTGRAAYPIPPRNGSRERDREGWEQDRERGRERDPRWNERRDDRYPGDTRQGPPRPPSPHSRTARRFTPDHLPPRSPPTAPRGPRSLAERTPPLSTRPRIPSGPASVTGATPRDDFRRSLQGEDGIPSAPRGPRIWRGTSSPADSKQFRPNEAISPATISEPTVPPSLQMKTEIDGDLEEGEVVSPTLGMQHSPWAARTNGDNHSYQAPSREGFSTRMDDSARMPDRRRDEWREAIPLGPKFNDRTWEDDRSPFAGHSQERSAREDRSRPDERLRHQPDPHSVGREHQNSRRTEFDRSPPRRDPPRFPERSAPDEHFRAAPPLSRAYRSRSQDGQREFSSAPSRLQETSRPAFQPYENDRPLSRRLSPVKMRRGSRGRGGSSSPVKRPIPRPRRPSDSTPWATGDRDDGWASRGRSHSTQSDRRRISDGEARENTLGVTSTIHPLIEEDEDGLPSGIMNDVEMEDVKPNFERDVGEVQDADEDMTDEELYRPATPAYPPEGVEAEEPVRLAVDPPFRPDTPAYPPDGEAATMAGSASARDFEDAQSRDHDGSNGQIPTLASDPVLKPVLPLEVPPVDGPRLEVERMATPPSPTGQSPPSDSAVTPALLTRRSSPDIEIVINSDSNSGLHEERLIPKAEVVLHVDENISMEVDLPDAFPVKSSLRRVTIAERRAVILAPTNNPLSSPFGEKFTRRDPNPTGDSMMEGSTDTEMEAAPDSAKTTIPFESPQGVLEDDRRARVIEAVKRASEKPAVHDVEAITAWNTAAAPSRDSRAPVKLSPRSRERRLLDITWPLSRIQSRVAKIVANVIRREASEAEDRNNHLRAEYMELDADWKDHIEHLDRLMEKRGPPPAALYATPNTQPLTLLAPHPITTPGPVNLGPTTPIDESFTARVNRRRGVGDAVTTEAEFQEILQNLADTAAKDPEVRASKTTAIIPDMLPPVERNMFYDDDNDLVNDPLAFYDYAGIGEAIWTENDRSLFQKRYLAWPKEFGKISNGIPGKSASDCVSFYYRTKKEENYKDLLASRRGDKKKRGPIVKKAGKGSALLADLDRQKPTMLPPSSANDLDEGTSTTPARSGVGHGGVPGSIEPAVRRLKGMTPSMMGDRRRKVLSNGLAGEYDEGTELSAGPSRAGSETPPVNRLKMRMNLKVGSNTAKRPRISSLSENLDGMPSPIEESRTDSPTDPLGPASPVQIDLLPPVRRTAKRPRRAESITDPNAPIATPSAVIDDPMNGTTAAGLGVTRSARKTTTNSYWSVLEKDKFRELVAVHGTNVRVIAGLMGGKTERQIANFYELQREKMGLDDLARNATGQVAGMEDEKVNGFAHPPLYSRSIYDVYPAGTHRASDAFNHPFGEPRLGTFPPNHYSHPPPSLPLAEPSPIKNFVSRPGGMNISALLNSDGPGAEKPGIANMDGASDGTVSERDAEDEDGVTKPSPRSSAQISKPGLPSMRDRQPSFGPYDRPEMDRYRASSAPKQFPYDPTLQPAWPRRPDPTPPGYYPPRAATTAPTLPPQHRASWDASSHLPAFHPHTQQHPHPPPLSQSHSQPASRSHPPLGMFNVPQPHRLPPAAYDNRPKGPGHEWHYPTQTYAAAAGSRGAGVENGVAPYTGPSLPPMVKTSPQPPQLPNIDPALQ